MRSQEEILNISNVNRPSYRDNNEVHNKLMLETLLDIRELLKPEVKGSEGKE